jgi:hypothetical protein
MGKQLVRALAKKMSLEANNKIRNAMIAGLKAL